MEKGFTDLALILGCDTLPSVLLTVPSRVSSTRMPSQERLMVTVIVNTRLLQGPYFRSGGWGKFH